MTTTLSWSLPDSGGFNYNGNWTPAESPSGAVDTLIAASGPAYTVSVGIPSAAGSVTLSSADATLALSQTLTIGTSLTLNAGTVQVNLGGAIQAGSVLLTGAGTLLEFTSAATFGDTAFTIGNPLGGTGAAPSTLGNYAVIDNVTLTLDASLAVTNGSGAEYYTGFNPHDEIDSKTALAFNTAGDGGTIDGFGIFLNEAGISVGGGASLVVGDGINTMTFNDKAGVTVTSGGSFKLNTLVTTTGVGAITLDGGSFAELGSRYAQTVDFGAGGAAKLRIDTASQFTGTLANIAKGDIINLGTTVTHATLSATQLLLTTPSGNIAYAVSTPGYTGDLLLAADPSSGTDVIVPCFAAGTRIATADGEQGVETLGAGDLVRTAGGVLRPVTWVGRRRIDCVNHADPDLVLPIRICANALGAGLPGRDLLLSPDHAVFVDGLLVPVRLLVNHVSIVVAAEIRAVEYVHVELPEHDILLAEGLPAESYLDTGNRETLLPSGPAARAALSDAAQMRLARSCAPLATDAARVKPIWQRIAVAAGATGKGRATTTDPDLRLLHRGRSLRPIKAAHDRHVFAVDGGGTARLVSRASRPSDLQPWHDDRRRLGVRVSRIIARGSGAMVLPVDDPALGHGWWDHEEAEGGRWTNGDAELPIASGTMLLEVTAHPLDLYRLGAAA